MIVLDMCADGLDHRNLLETSARLTWRLPLLVLPHHALLWGHPLAWRLTGVNFGVLQFPPLWHGLHSRTQPVTMRCVPLWCAKNNKQELLFGMAPLPEPELHPPERLFAVRHA